MSEDEIRRIRQVFDTDYKQLKRMNERKQSYGLEFVSVDCVISREGETKTFDIPDEFDMEESIMHQLDLAHLGEVLQCLSEDDRCFILDAYNSEINSINALAEKYGISWHAAKRRKEKLLAVLREKFLE